MKNISLKHVFASFFFLSFVLSANVFAESKRVSDPLETVNRKIYHFNVKFDDYVAKPVAKGYRNYVPSPVRGSIRNFFNNLKTPITIVNSVLQLDFDNSMNSLWRFSVNTTVGVGGLFDVASKQEVINRDEDFGQTLGRYGVGNGFYIMIPFLGSSTLRDGVGIVVDSVSDPIYSLPEDDSVLNEISVRASLNVIEAIDTREKYLELFDEIQRTSFDSYGAMKTMYIQRRDFEVENKKTSR